MIEFTHHLRGEDVQIEVTHVAHVPPSRYADNPHDYYGYFEADYTVTGPAGEITNLTTDEDRAICAAIKEWLKDED